MADDAMDRIQDAVPLYDRYLEVSRVASLSGFLRERPEFYAPEPAPLTLTLTTR